MLEHTTSNYTGMIAVILGVESWVTKWNGLSNRLPGCYAISLMAELTSLFSDNNEVSRAADEEEDLSNMPSKVLSIK